MLPGLFLKKTVELMPYPKPENYLTYFADFDMMYRDYCRWARNCNRKIVDKPGFAGALLGLSPGVGWYYRGSSTEVTGIRYHYGLLYSNPG